MTKKKLSEQKKRYFRCYNCKKLTKKKEMCYLKIRKLCQKCYKKLKNHSIRDSIPFKPSVKWVKQEIEKLNGKISDGFPLNFGLSPITTQNKEKTRQNG